MEDHRTVLFDASPYMLFEASGDSEADQHSDGAFEPESDAQAEENDAQSCSSYGLLTPAAGSVHEADDDAGSISVDDFCSGDFDDRSGDEEEDEGCSDEEEEGVVDQCCPVAKENSKKSQACEDPKNVREGDKLFWEACLAS